MDAFQEFDQPPVPEKTGGAIISHAFEMYKGVFIYALAVMIIYGFASMLVQPISGFDSQIFAEDISSGADNLSMMNMWAMPGMGLYTGLSGLLGILLAPLFVGLIYMANKYNTAQKLNFSDLFIAYRQNTLNIMIYSLISSIILGFSFVLCFLPLFFVFPFFLLGYPILLFENASFSEALSKSFSIAKENYMTFLVAGVLGALISMAGIFLCFIGLIATLPFYLVVMYSTYCAYLGRPRELIAAE